MNTATLSHTAPPMPVPSFSPITLEHRSFQIIPCPAGVSGSHTHLVVSGWGMPHEPLTLFYEELQKRCVPETVQTRMRLLLSFFSFLEEPQSLGEVTSLCRREEWFSSLESLAFPSSMAWAAPPSELRAAIRFYLAARWGCRARRHGLYEDIHLSPFTQGEHELRFFLAELQQFYRFCIERRDYWYAGNPAGAFRLPLRSRLMHVIMSVGLSQRSRPVLNQRKGNEGVIRERPRQTVHEPALRA